MRGEYWAEWVMFGGMEGYLDRSPSSSSPSPANVDSVHPLIVGGDFGLKFQIES